MKLIGLSFIGNSMNPTIADGDMVICKPLDSNSEVENNEVYAVIGNNSVWVKRIQRFTNENGICTHLKLISDNSSEFDPFLVDVHEVRKLLHVTQVIKKPSK